MAKGKIDYWCAPLIESPTGAPDNVAHYLPGGAFELLPFRIKDLTVTRTTSPDYGAIDVMQGAIDGVPHVVAYIRRQDCGFAWTRPQLAAELKAITDQRQLAAATLFFGQLAHDVLSKPTRRKEHAKA